MKAETSTDTWKNIGLFPSAPATMVVISTKDEKFSFNDLRERVELVQKIFELADEHIEFKVSYRHREPLKRRSPR